MKRLLFLCLFSASGMFASVAALTGQVSSSPTPTTCADTAGQHLNWTGTAWVCGSTGPSGTAPTPTTAGQSPVANGAGSYTIGIGEVPAAAFSIICDGTTDTTAGLNSSSTSGYTIHLPDFKSCLISAPWTPASNTRWVCKGCSIVHKTTDTGNAIGYFAYKSSIELDGVILDDNGTNHQSFVGTSTALVTTSGGSGWQPGYKVPWTSTGGGCTSPARGYFTTDGSGVPNAVSAYVSGYGCTSVPTGWSIGTYCGDGYSGCVAPALTWASGLTPQSATTNGALVYLDHCTGIIFRDVTLRSTGATVANMEGADSGVSTFHTEALFDHLTIENTIQGPHVFVDSDGFAARKVTIRNISSDGSQFYGVQFKGHPNYAELNGGTISNVGDALIGSGQQGNGISIFDTDHTYVHGVTVLNPYFSGVRVTGNGGTSGTPTANNRIEDITIEGNQEMGLWAELGAENNYFRNITVRPSSTQLSAGCFEDTNGSQKPNYGYNYFDEMHCVGQIGVGGVAEHAVVKNSTFVDVAIPIRVGFGGTGEGNFLSGNTCSNTGGGYSTSMFCFFLDRFKGTTSKTVGISTLSSNMPVEYPFGSTAMQGTVFAQFDAFPVISGITAANPAVISYYASSAVTWPFSVGNSYVIEGVYGFTNSAGQSINGKICGVTAINTTTHTVTCGGFTGVAALDASGYTATPFTLAPAGRGNAMLWWVYTGSGTTAAWSANTNFHISNAFAN